MADFENFTNLSTIDQLCSKEINSIEILTGVVNGIAIVINLFFLLVLSRRQQVLRQNFENLHVANVLFSILVMSLVSLLDLAITAYLDAGPAAVEESYIPTHALQVQFLGFIRAFRLSMVLTTSSCLLTLIYGQRRDSRFMNKIDNMSSKSLSFRQTTTKREHEVKKFYKVEKYKAIVSTMLCWLCGLGFAISVPIGWNCISEHPCFAGHLRIQHKFYTSFSKEFETNCSFFWPPTTTNFVITITLSWIVINLLMLSLLIFVVKSNFDNVEARNPNPQNTKWEFSSLKSSIKGIVIICLISFIMDSPFVLSLFYNAVAHLEISQTTVQATILLSYIHAILCPVILFIYVPGVKSAILNAMAKCSCLWKTTLEQKADEATQSLSSPDLEDIPLDEYWHLMTLGSRHVGPNPNTPEQEEKYLQ